MTNHDHDYYHDDCSLCQTERESANALQDSIIGALARGYCSEKNSHKILDPDLIDGMTKEVMKILLKE